MFKKQPTEIEKIVDEAITEVTNEKEFEDYIKLEKEEQEVAISNSEIHDIFRKVQEGINDVDKHITNRKEEDINVMKLIFTRLNFIKKHINKWFFAIIFITLIFGAIIGAVLSATCTTWLPYLGMSVEGAKAISKLIN